MPTPAADDFAVIWQRQCAIREAADNARNAAGCAYAEDRPQSECTVCNDPADAVRRLYPQTDTRCRSDGLPDLLAPAFMGMSGAMRTQ